MDTICNTCGLPTNLCVCKEIAKESQKVKIRVFRRRFGKFITLITGMEDAKIAKELAKTLKQKLACGGTVKGTEIELQGDHKKRAKEILLREGYKENLIET